MKKIFAIAAAVLLVFSLYGHALAADVALTSVGQSPDAMMIRVVLRNMGIAHDYDSLMQPEMLADQKVLIAVVGGSSKGLGAAVSMRKRKPKGPWPSSMPPRKRA